jgi:hypothetical protein
VLRFIFKKKIISIYFYIRLLKILKNDGFKRKKKKRKGQSEKEEEVSFAKKMFGQPKDCQQQHKSTHRNRLKSSNLMMTFLHAMEKCDVHQWAKSQWLILRHRELFKCEER